MQDNELNPTPLDEPRPPANDVDDVAEFKRYIVSELGLSENTLIAYGHHLTKFIHWMQGNIGDYLHPQLEDFTSYMEVLKRDGLAPVSVQHHIIAVKVFYRYLRLQKRTTSETADMVDVPKAWKRLPRVLTPAEVVQLLDAPQPRDRHYLRDRALLETLYASGARVSELVNLTLDKLHLDAGHAECTGKGKKERLLLLGAPAVAALRAYLDGERPRLASGWPDLPWVFLSQQERRPVRSGFGRW
jgi:integrase/recombinase XerD